MSIPDIQSKVYMMCGFYQTVSCHGLAQPLLPSLYPLYPLTESTQVFTQEDIFNLVTDLCGFLAGRMRLLPVHQSVAITRAVLQPLR